MRLKEIHLRDAERNKMMCWKAYLDVASGFRGAPAGKPDRQISLLAGELLPDLRTLGGLCTAKFDADLITEGLDYCTLKAGDRLEIGSATIIITAQGKRCFDECPIRQRGERCPLPANCAFARVERGGPVAVGDGIKLDGRSRP